MAGSRMPGPLGSNPKAPAGNLNDGTHVRGRSPVPGPVGAESGRTSTLQAPTPPAAPAVSTVTQANLPANAPGNVEKWDMEDRFSDVLKRTLGKLPGSMQHEFAALLTPTNLAIMAGTLALWAASHLAVVGEVVDILLVLSGAFFLGMAVFDVMGEFADCLKLTINAKTTNDLDGAASHLARAVSIIGVAVFVAFLAKIAMKVKGSKGGDSASSGSGAAGEGAAKSGAAEGSGKSGKGDAGSGKSGANEGTGEKSGNAAAEEAAAEGKGKKACACAVAGKPVDVINGCKVLLGPEELDFDLPAPLPLRWQRSYTSDNPLAGVLGQGWSLPISLALEFSTHKITLLDPQHRGISFPLLQEGGSFYSQHEQISLTRLDASTFELQDKESITHRFTLPGPGAHVAQLVAQLDRNGNTIRIEYDASQQPTRIIDSAGRVLLLQFNDQRRLLSVSEQRTLAGDAALETVLLVRYEYDAAGDLIAVHNRAGQTTRQFGYRNHIMIKHAQPGGLVSEYEYNEYTPQGRVQRNSTNTGQSWQFAYARSQTLVTDNLGRKVYHQFNADKRYTGQTDAMGGKERLELDAFGNLLAHVDATGATERYQYDERGRATRIVAADGAVTRINWDGRANKPASITDAMGAITQMRYDTHANLVALVDALGQRTEYRYDERGLPVELIDARGGSKRMQYNAFGQVTTYTDCSGQTTRFEYDRDGNLRQRIDAMNQRTSWEYDAVGRLLAARYPDGSSEEFEYDALGRLVAHTDANGQHTRYQLDQEGRLLARSNALGGQLAYRYDEAKRLAQLINENGAVYAFNYDPLDRLVQETGFDARTTRYRYDAAGRALGKTGLGQANARHHDGSDLTAADAANGEPVIETVFKRDAAGRLLEKRVSGGTAAQRESGALHTRYQYDALGRLTLAANEAATVELGYDAIGQLLSEKSVAGDAISLLAHQYDVLGNRIRTTLPDGRVLNHLFYGSGHLHQINLDGEVISDIERDARHREISRTQGEVISRFQYDPVGRLTAQLAKLDPARANLAAQRSQFDSAGSGPATGAAPAASGGNVNLIARVYRYDAGGNLTGLRDLRFGQSTYQYDAIGRILGAAQPGLAETFAFDPAHNLLDAGTPPAGGRLENNQITVFEDKRYTYDAHGNLIDKKAGRHTHVQLRWNAEHQLVQSTTTRNAYEASPAQQTTTYAYDPFGRRIFKRDAFGETRFVWDGNRLLAESRGSRTRTWLYDGGSFVPLAQVDSQTPATGATPAPAGAGAKILYFHTDHLGTPRELTDGAGNLHWAATYKAWGNVMRVEMPQARPVTQAVAGAADPAEQLQSLRFQGQYFDCETGLHYNRFRYYDPDIGRFISEDPIGLKGGTNTFVYAANPTGWVDPLGLTSLVKGAPLPDGTNIYRVSTEGPYNFDFNPRELAAIESGKLNPPGVSVIRAGSPEEATGIWNKAFPNRPATSVGEMNAQEIRAAGYDVIHDPSKGALGENHARLIHPDGVKGFNADKDKLTTKFMKCSC